MKTIEVAPLLRSDARVRPSEAGGELGKHLVKEKLIVEPVILELRDVHPAVLISAFFVNFMEAVHAAGGLDSVRHALENINWRARYDFQTNNIGRWMAPYKDKLLGEGAEVEITDALSLPDRLSVCQQEKETVMRLFRSCKVWKAIQTHIEKADADECGFVNKRDGLVHHRGTGAFSLKKVYAYPPGANDPRNAVRFCFDVSCWDEENEREVDVDVMLDVPLQLVIDFDQQLFDEWVAEQSKERRKRDLKNAREKLEKLLKRYPELRAEHHESK